jgi:hypothetical protein
VVQEAESPRTPSSGVHRIPSSPSMPSAQSARQKAMGLKTPSTPSTPAYQLTPSTVAPHSRPTMTQDAWRRVAELKETLAENRYQMSTLEGEGARPVGALHVADRAGFMRVNIPIPSSCYG